MIIKGANDATSNNEALTPSLRNVRFHSSNFYLPSNGDFGWHESQLGCSDMHIPSGSFLRGRGADLSAITPSSFQPSVGIDRQPRVLPWDIGADEITTPKVIKKLIMPSGGGDYTTIQDWANARKGNLAIRDTIEMAILHGGNSGPLILNKQDWGSNHKNYPVLIAASGHRHNGTYQPHKAMMKLYDGQRKLIQTSVGGLQIRGIVLDADSVVDYPEANEHIRVSGVNMIAPMYIDGNIFKVTAIGGAWSPRFIVGAPINWDKSTTYSYNIIKNNIFLGVGVTGGYNIQLEGAWKFYNNTGVGWVMFRSEQNPYKIEFRNNYWKALIVSDIMSVSVYDATSTAESANPALRNIAYSSANFISVIAGQEDWRLTPNSALRGKGVDVDGVDFDINGVPRPAGKYDIGAFQSSQDAASFFAFLCGSW
jgi:hypothetical protein